MHEPNGADGDLDPSDAERAEHPESFDPGIETGYLRRGPRDHDLPVEVGAAPFDPGPSHYDSRRAKRARRREEKAERKRRARAEQLERERRARLEELASEKRARVEQLEREERARAERLEREKGARAEKLERERAKGLERERLERAERLERERLARAEELERERRDYEERMRLEAERRQAERLARAEAERRARAEAEHRAQVEAERRGRPIRLKATGRPQRRARAAPLTATPPPGRSLKRPTAKAGLALAAVVAVATGLGSLLGLPIPLPSSGSPEQSRAALSPAAALKALDGGTPVELTDGPYHPVVGQIGYGEGPAKFGAPRGGRLHEGQDVFAEIGTPLVAIRDGIVLDGGGGRNFYASGGGHTAVIYSPIDDRSYVYLHMHKPALVKAGEKVSAGQPIGQLGCTGSCFGPHLHFEVRLGRADWGAKTKAINPLPLLKQWPKRPTGP